MPYIFTFACNEKVYFQKSMGISVSIDLNSESQQSLCSNMFSMLLFSYLFIERSLCFLLVILK